MSFSNNNNNNSFRRVFDLDSVFNERASPRSKLFSDFYGMFDMNPSLFPQSRLHNFILEPSTELRSMQHNQMPSSSSFTTSPRVTSTRLHHNIRQQAPRNELITATAIPVVHLSSNSTSNSSSSPSCSTTTSKKDSEAEVDALSNILMKSIGKNYNNKDSSSSTKIHMSISSPSTSSTSIHQPSQPPYSSKRAPALSQSSRSFSTPSPTNSLSRQSSINTNECYRCRKSLDSSTASKAPELIAGPLQTMFHQACFTCYRCNCPINSDSFFYAQKRLLCSRCVHESLEKCTICDLVINDRIIRVLGKPYHPKCFSCVACGLCLDGRPFTVDTHERMFCLDDFHRRYAPRCDACGNPIKPPDHQHHSGGIIAAQQNKWIIAGRKTYHLECFGLAQDIKATN